MRFVGVPVADGLSFVSPTPGLTWRSTGRAGTLLELGERQHGAPVNLYR